MREIATRRGERLSLVKRADEWKDSILGETPDKLLEFVGSVQQMLMVKLDRIEHKIELKKLNKEVKQEAKSNKSQKNKIASALVELKTTSKQNTIPTKFGNTKTKKTNIERAQLIVVNFYQNII